MVKQLISCLKEYKTQLDYKNVDFNADVIAMYSHVRRQMAMFFVKECFGALELPEPEKDIDKMTKEEVQYIMQRRMPRRLW